MTVQPRPHMVRDVHTGRPCRQNCAITRLLTPAPPQGFAEMRRKPRQGLRAGHIPGSKNLPFTQVLNGDHTMKTTAELNEEFRKAGVDLSKPAITTCGSGVTAALLSLALERIGKTDHALYDGSWTEWGQFPTLNVATGDS